MPLTVTHGPIDPSQPKDDVILSRLPAFIRDTRARMLSTDILNVAFESNVETGDAVYLDPEAHIWKRSLANPDPEFAERYRFHGIAHAEDQMRTVRVFGFIAYAFWNFPEDAVMYVSPTDVGKLTHEAPDHNKPLVAGYAVHIDILLIDSSLSYWEDLRDEIWDARGVFDTLEGRLDDEEARLQQVEIEITNARGEHATLTAHLNHMTGRIVLLEDEIETARDTFANLGLRLDDMTSRITSLEDDLGILTGRVDEHDGDISLLDGRVTVNEEDIDALETRTDETESRLDSVDTQLEDIYTKSETHDVVTAMSEELAGVIQAILSGDMEAVPDLWELDGTEVSGSGVVACNAGDTFAAGSYFLINSAFTGDYYVWITLEGEGSDPEVEGRTGIQVDALITDSATAIATKIADAIHADGAFTATSSSENVTITEKTDGYDFAVLDGSTSFAFVTTESGQLGGIQEIDGLTEYFLINPEEQLFQGSFSYQTTTRDIAVDALLVTDSFFYAETSDGDIIPRGEILT